MHTVDTHHSTRGARRCAAPSKRGLVAWCYSTQCSPSLDRWSSGSSTPARSARSAANGLESFTTVVLDSLHYESHLMCTNCGPLGLKADVGAVDQPRGALGPLVGAHRALERRPRGGRRRLRRARSAPTTSSSRSTGTASCSCLVAYVLIFIKHIPSCQPNLSYAQHAVQQVVRDPVDRVQPAAPVEAQEDQAAHDARPLRGRERRLREVLGCPSRASTSRTCGPTQNGHLSPFASSSWWTSCAACSAASTTRRSSTRGRTRSTTRRPPRRTSSR